MALTLNDLPVSFTHVPRGTLLQDRIWLTRPLARLE